MRYCLAEGGVPRDGLDAVAFYDKPITKFARILETYFGVAPRGLRSFMMADAALAAREAVDPRRDREGAGPAPAPAAPGEMYFPEHHESHAASAFFPSRSQSAAILTWTASASGPPARSATGSGNRLEMLEEIHFPHSLGLLYSAFTYFTGFRVNSGEYKLMGLAPYGEPKYVDAIREHLIDLRDDGSFRLNMDYFGYLDGLTMTNERFAELFGGPPRAARSPTITQREMDLARSIQVVTEEIVLRMARHAARASPARSNLCLAGGVALNCVANGRLLREGPFEDIWIQPAAGDAGGALGAACIVWHQVQDKPRAARRRQRPHAGLLSGPRLRRRRDRGLPRTPRATRTSSLADGELDERVARLDRRREGGRPVPGPHGVRAAGAGQPLDHRRCPLAARCSRS